MPEKMSFRKLAESILLEEAKTIKPISEKPIKVLTIIAQSYFYLGNHLRAREISFICSNSLENRAKRRFSKGYMTFGIADLFDCALYRSLSGKEDKELWSSLIESIQNISEELILEQKMVDVWVYEAYALLKLNKYDGVIKPAKKGFIEIDNGKSMYEVPSNNSRTYRLASLLIDLSEFRVNQTLRAKQKAQESLLLYKEENFIHGRLGYDIIFDLQFSYPDILKPVLPGSNSDED